MDQEAQNSVLKRSTSLWRRFSTRKRTESAEQQQSAELSGRHKLQKRTTETARRPEFSGQNRNHIMDRREVSREYRGSNDEGSPRIIGQMRRIDVQIPTSRLLTPSPTPSPPSTASRTSGNSTPLESRTRVLPTDVSTTPFPRSPHIQTTPWNIFLTPDQVYALVQGFRPEEMEDKWFIYSEGPDHSGKLKVHFHRSWTGLKVAELFVVIDLRGEGAGKIVGIKWDGGKTTNGMDIGEVKYTIEMVCRWVLRIDLEAERAG